MAACSGETGGAHLWTAFSAASFRRKLSEALFCGRTGINLPKEKPPEEPSRRGRSDRLSDLLKTEAEERSEALRDVVAMLIAGGDRMIDAAREVRRLAKDDAETRERFGRLGAIPPLVSMIESPDPDLQEASLYALLNLGVANDRNKAMIVEEGAVHKMLAIVEDEPRESVSEAIAASFLSLSALDANKPLIGASGAVRFLAEIFRDPSRGRAGEDALRAILNLSIVPENVPRIVETGLIGDILAAVGDMRVSEKLLSVLSNAVGSAEGRKALSANKEAIPVLIDVLRWADSPGCQEKAAYVLMVMAHKESGDRSIMIEAGIVSPLLELTLMGSSLAQRRASRLLDCLRVTKGKEAAGGFPAMSAPVYGSEWDDETGISDERKAVKNLVQQSLISNMRRIARRANLPPELGPLDHLKPIATSKSLPF